MVSQNSMGDRALIPLDEVRRAAIDDAAESILNATIPPNTKLAFAQDWDRWTEFCAEQQVPTTTVSSGLLVGYATWLAHGSDTRPAAAPATITRRLSGVLDGWKRLHVDVSHGVTSDARQVVRAYAKYLAQENLPAGRGKAPALTIRDLRRIINALPRTLAGTRDRAVILIGFGTAGRRSEIAHLLVSDIEEHPEGLSVRIRDSKTGARTPAVPRGQNSETCPVQAWRSWLAESGIIAGPAFRRVTRNGRILGPLAAQSIGMIVTKAGERVGLDARLTGHSLRSGLATEARRAGHDAKTIAQQGGWLENSAQLYGYMQIVDRWADNAVKGIGL